MKRGLSSRIQEKGQGQGLLSRIQEEGTGLSSGIQEGQGLLSRIQQEGTGFVVKDTGGAGLVVKDTAGVRGACRQGYRRREGDLSSRIQEEGGFCHQ